MNSASNLTIAVAVMAPLNVAAAIFVAMLGFERVMDWLDDNTPDDPDAFV